MFGEFFCKPARNSAAEMFGENPARSPSADMFGEKNCDPPIA